MSETRAPDLIYNIYLRQTLICQAATASATAVISHPHSVSSIVSSENAEEPVIVDDCRQMVVSHSGFVAKICWSNRKWQLECGIAVDSGRCMKFKLFAPSSDDCTSADFE